MRRRFLLLQGIAALSMGGAICLPAGPVERGAALAGLMLLLVSLWLFPSVEGELVQTWSRAIRHQLANRLQVVAGWTKLGRHQEAERALDYVYVLLEGWRRFEQLPMRLAGEWARLIPEWERLGRSVLLSGEGRPRDWRSLKALLRAVRRQDLAEPEEIVVDLVAGTVKTRRANDDASTHSL